MRGDLDLDGDVDSTDKTAALNNAGASLAWGNLSDRGNRKGYAGYELDDALDGNAAIYHVRNRVNLASIGRWTRRDDLGYVDGMNLYEYVRSNPLGRVDPHGNAAIYSAYVTTQDDKDPELVPAAQAINPCVPLNCGATVTTGIPFAMVYVAGPLLTPGGCCATSSLGTPGQAPGLGTRAILAARAACFAQVAAAGGATGCSAFPVWCTYAE